MTQEDPGLQELVGDFVTESREHLANVESDLLSLEGAAGGEETVNRVFRAVHSVKGVAGFLGLEHINKLSHKLESVLDLVRKGRLDVSADLCSALLFATDALRELIDHVTDSNTIPIEEPIGRLQVFLEGSPVAGAGARPMAPPVVAVEAAADEWVVELAVVTARVALALNSTPDEVVDTIARLGRVVSGGAALAAAADTTLREPIRVHLVTKLPPEDLRLALQLEGDEITTLRRPTSPASAPAVASSPCDPQPAAETAPEAAPVAARDQAPPAKEPRGDDVEAAPAAHANADANTGASRASAAERPRTDSKKPEHAGDAHNDSIRVSVALLDRLMNLSGELVLGRNQLIQAHSVKNEQGANLAATRLSQVVSEMQEAIMQTRMQPIGSLFQRFPRVVRDLSGKLGKRCRLDISGKDVELDRSILEALSDPLTHLVRNAVDHGMETPEQRRAAGKPVEGQLRLLAVQQGGNVRLEIADDGRGINPAVLRKKAVEKGVITEAEARAMSDREAVNLIFAPGFSTAEKVTDVSGRGVGMDVVRSNIEKLGGHVEVQSTVGRGTTLTITIPLTLAILPAMVISCGPRRYVLAQANVAELVRVQSATQKTRTTAGEGAASIVALDGKELLRLRGAVLPLLRLRNVLGEPLEDQDGQSTIIVVETASLRYGLVVDAPPDAEEIVVKPLGKHLKQRNEFAGATILGDGRVAMILDASGIAESANLAVAEAAQGAKADEAAAGQDKDRAELVLFRNHPEETFAVPLGLVDRIQRIDRSALREVGGTTVYAEGERVLPIVRLESTVQVKPPEPTPRVSVLVMRIDRTPFGLVAPGIEDIRTVSFRIDDKTLAQKGVLGSFQLQDRTVRLIDPSAVARAALPQLFSELPAKAPVAVVPARAAAGGVRDTAAPTTGAATRVLFAEDTKFFREHVSRTLTGAGFEVVAAADGELAWTELMREGATFDVVVTDVQMPNCDGLELTRRIRRSPEHEQLPVIALTSLSSSEHEEEGRAAGVTAYLVKLDDAALVAAVREHAGVKA
ncbi:MAG: chemotaxis protein CheW [Planctomycetes bacterium]|nr:chemotaxis protein CheW [Planctomycetota bacterium]